MEIKTIEIKEYSTAKLCIRESGIHHKKSLPMLSVVQALEGSYGIGIDTPSEQQTGALGAFIAPSDKTQYITHTTDPLSGQMRAHWIFLDVTVNSFTRFDDLFDFPVLLPPEYQEAVCQIIRNVSENRSLCADLSEIYKLIDILLQIGWQKKPVDNLLSDIKLHVNKNYREKITAEQMALHFGVSVPTLFRKFQQFFQCSPANYVNGIRLQKASVLLETTGRQIGDISEAVGFHDVFYFSRIFKNKYDVSPSQYRSNFIYSATGDGVPGRHALR